MMRKIIEMSSARAITLSVCFVIAATSAALSGCVKSGEQPAETKPQPQATQPAPAATKQPEPNPAPQQAHETAPPSLGEVESAITRVYEGTVTLDPNRFLVGDLDGDRSQDLIAIVKPIAAKLPEINSDLARWKIEDPHKAFVPKFVTSVKGPPPIPPPVLADQSDVLMVVIQGHGTRGWRDPEAMSSYLLKNAVGSGISMQSLKEARSAARSKNKPLNLRGDVIKQTLGKETGFLFWTGAEYAWYPLQGNKTADRRASL